MKESHEGEARREGCLPLFMAWPFQLIFHDSEVSQVTTLGDEGLRVRFSAAHVRSNGGERAPFTGQGAFGHVRGLEMRCAGARWTGEPADCIGRLAGGTLMVDAASQPVPPLRFMAAGQVQLDLVFQNGANLSVRANAIAFCLDDDASFAESHAC
ncbi:MAG: hypothetical protein EOP40_06560 [Rubrivivax sp.]|nr:MAG: hypothetical protein EOP40_06560 [Rubrivivax sp.]